MGAILKPLAMVLWWRNLQRNVDADNAWAVLAAPRFRKPFDLFLEPVRCNLVVCDRASGPDRLLLLWLSMVWGW